MARIMAIDYGSKRVGIAVTDPLQIIANGLTTCSFKRFDRFFEKIHGERTGRMHCGWGALNE
jgi:putative Holliday junction resolvase